MKFGPVPLDHAVGKILGHNIAATSGQRLFRKGKPLTEADVQLLRDSGHTRVYVAELDVDDIGEDAAARALAAMVAGPGVQPNVAGGGRVNLVVAQLGIVRVDVARLNALNELNGITVATVAHNTALNARRIAATIKIIPFAISASALARAQTMCDQPIVRVDPLPHCRVALILSGLPGARDRVVADFDHAIRARIDALGSTLVSVDYLPLESDAAEADLATHLTLVRNAGAQLIVLAGETAIMDRQDIVPRAIEQAGGQVEVFGAPVDPGNLLMIAYLGNVPVLGAPGCARSRKTNVIDWVLPRLLAGDRLLRSDIVALGAGGLLEDISERPMPRGD
jgi:molybdenum cofactor cytidylyltransferase